jgi:hypothetical protein
MNEWNVPLLKTTFLRQLDIEAEFNDNYSSVPLTAAAREDSIAIIVSTVDQGVDTCRVSRGRFIRVSDNRTTARKNQPEISFMINNTLSNVPYDIAVVFATPLARYTTEASKAEAQLKRQVTAKIRFYPKYDSNEMHKPGNAVIIGSNIDVDATKMDTVIINTASAYKNGVTFPVCNYGEPEARVIVTLQSLKGNNALLKKGYAQDLYIDEIIMIPRIEENK